VPILTNDPMKEPAKARCGAWARSVGRPCEQWPVAGKRRCRMHGGRNPGPPRGNKLAFKTGEHTAAAKQARRAAAAARREAQAAIKLATASAEAATRRPPGRPRKVKASG
jgi:hypothetical protein